MPEYERRAVGGNFYLRDAATGLRTKLYINLEAARRAADRGELMTEEEYAAYRAGPVAAAPRKALNKKRRAA